jgi:hypothetical protein
LSKLASKFENDCAVMSCISTGTTPNISWYLDNGASRHITKAREIFNIFSENDLDLQIELANETKYEVKGQGRMQFKLDSGGSFDAQEVLYVHGLKKNLLSISVM